MITHDMQLMLDYSDRAVVVMDGQILADLPPAELLTQPDILKRANLKETSIFALANRLGVDPLALTQFYMHQKGKVMNHRLVGYHAGTSFLHRLSGASKLLFLTLGIFSCHVELRYSPVVGNWSRCPRLICNPQAFV